MASTPSQKGSDLDDMGNSHQSGTGNPVEDDNTAQLEREESQIDGDGDNRSGSSPKPQKRERSPAYVAPIPKIGSIPPIQHPRTPLAAAAPEIRGPPDRPKLPPFVGSYLVGKPVDDYGDIVDEKTGQVLARAGGDLPALVGRKVSNRQGDILGDDGELLGYVLDVEIERKGSGAGSSSPVSPRSAAAATTPMRSLFEMMGRSTSSLMVDPAGNILDVDGNVVGKFHDNNNPSHRKEKEEREARERAERERQQQQQQKEKEKESRGVEKPVQGQKGYTTCRVDIPVPTPPPEQRQEPEDQEEEDGGEPEQQGPPPPSPPLPTPPDGQQRRPRRTEEERRENAAAWRKENPGESPSDIFLDVKSTTEGIQLTIRIPTVFGGQHVAPKISFS